MINEQDFFQGFSFPWVIIDSEKSILASANGAIFPYPISADFAEIVEENSLSPEGWSCCTQGLARFCVRISNLNKWMICFGMKVKGVSTRSGKSAHLSVKVDRVDIEGLLNKTLSAFHKTEDQLKNIMRSSIHEVRSINTDIYHVSLNASDSNPAIKNKALKDIQALSGLLKDRVDFLDAISNPLMLAIRGGKSDIYRMFDKVVRSLDATAQKNNVTIRLTGDTQGRVEGIRLFSVIPYLMLQNALKYAPSNTMVEVNLREDDNIIYVMTSSWGPIVEEDEVSKIFRSGYRGRQAAKFEKDGTGIGLFFLKQLVEMHDGGKVSFYQDSKPKIIDGINFAQTHFNLRFLRAD